MPESPLSDRAMPARGGSRAGPSSVDLRTGSPRKDPQAPAEALRWPDTTRLVLRSAADTRGSLGLGLAKG